MSNNQPIEGDLQEIIRNAAFYKWEAAGRPNSDGIDFWLQAEKEYLASNGHAELPAKQAPQAQETAIAAA